MVKFFTPAEEARIIDTIRMAERQTSGEIRIHLEHKPRAAAMEDAKRVFQELRMHETRDRNGVLILLAPERREFAILGDNGINAVVPPNFWDEERDIMQTHFRRGAFCEGLVAVIIAVGDKLREHFPFRPEEDENELPDDISYGH